MPKFGEWDVNDPASAEGFTVIFNKARDEKKTGGKPDSPSKGDPHIRQGLDPGKPPAVSSSMPKQFLVIFFYLSSSNSWLYISFLGRL